MQEIITFSNFYDNPSQMKDLFNNLDFVKNENMLKGSVCPLPFANDDMLNHMCQLVNAPRDSLEFVENSGVFIRNMAQDIPSRTVTTHFPSNDTQWVGILYMSDSKESHYLNFYKHQFYNFDSIIIPKERYTELGIYSHTDLENFIDQENIDFENKWSLTTRIEMKFNTLILFRPWLFHSYSDVFGDDINNCRLLQLFFLKPKQP